MNEDISINGESVTGVRKCTVRNGALEPLVVEASNGVPARSLSQSSISTAAATTTEDININVFYDEFIAFVAWSKKTQEVNRINLATVNTNVKQINLKCDKILNSGRVKKYNTAILPLLQCGDEVNCDFNSQNSGEEKAKNGIAENGGIKVERITLNKRPRPRLSPVKRKETYEDEDEEELVKTANSSSRRCSKRIRCMEAIEIAQDLAEEENKENATDAQEERNIVDMNLVTLRSEIKDFCATKHENNKPSFDEVLAEYNRLGFEAKRIYNKAKKLNIATPYIGPEIKVMIGQIEDHCLSFSGNDSQLSKQLDERFDLAKEMLNFDGEMEDCEEGGINEEIGENEMIVDSESLESDMESLQHFCSLYLHKSADKDFYTEAKRLCTRSVILTKLAKKHNYQVQRVEQLMDEVFENVSGHYESTAPSRELKYNLLMQNKRYKTKAKQLNYYDRFLGSKKLKVPDKKPLPLSPKKPTVSPIKLQLLPQVSIKKVQLLKKLNGKVEENEVLSCGASIEALLTRYNSMYKSIELFLKEKSFKSGEKRIEASKRLGIKRQGCCQLLKDAQAYERANWTDEEKVSAARMVIRGSKKISGIVADNENWFRRYPFVYYEPDSVFSKQTEESRKECLMFQKNQLKSLVLAFLEGQEAGKDCYENAVQLGTELVRLNRRSLELASEGADDIYRLTLRLYRNVSEFYEARASREQIQQHLQAHNKKTDTRRKVLHFYDSDAEIEQLSVDAFLKSSKEKGSRSTTTSHFISRSEAQSETDTLKPNKNPNTEPAKGVSSDIRCYFTKKSTPSTENNADEVKTDLSGIKGDWREGDRGCESESEAESNHSEYKASEVDPSEDGTEDEGASEEQNESERSDEESGESETSSDNEENDNDDAEEEDGVEGDESLEDKKCTVSVSGLSRHHTPVYMRSFLELKRIPVIKCNTLPGPKSAAPSIAVTVNAIHKKIINKLWGKTFKLTFHIH